MEKEVQRFTTSYAKLCVDLNICVGFSKTIQTEPHLLSHDGKISLKVTFIRNHIPPFHPRIHYLWNTPTVNSFHLHLDIHKVLKSFGKIFYNSANTAFDCIFLIL